VHSAQCSCPGALPLTSFHISQKRDNKSACKPGRVRIIFGPKRKTDTRTAIGPRAGGDAVTSRMGRCCCRVSAATDRPSRYDMRGKQQRAVASMDRSGPSKRNFLIKRYVRCWGQRSHWKRQACNDEEIKDVLTINEHNLAAL
jgi:hypothetical protein